MKKLFFYLLLSVVCLISCSKGLVTEQEQKIPTTANPETENPANDNSDNDSSKSEDPKPDNTESEEVMLEGVWGKIYVQYEDTHNGKTETGEIYFDPFSPSRGTKEYGSDFFSYGRETDEIMELIFVKDDTYVINLSHWAGSWTKTFTNKICFKNSEVEGASSYRFEGTYSLTSTQLILIVSNDSEVHHWQRTYIFRKMSDLTE